MNTFKMVRGSALWIAFAPSCLAQNLATAALPDDFPAASSTVVVSPAAKPTDSSPS